MKFGIIAAGEGSRLREEGVFTPKPLIKIGDKPLIGRLIDIFSESGATEINVIVNEQMHEVHEYLEERMKTMQGILKVIVKSTPSSMHSFYELTKNASLSDKFIITTVDTVFHKDVFEKYVESFNNCGNEIDGMMGVTSYIEDEKPLYVKVNEENVINAFLDRPEAGIKFVSAGIYGLGGKTVKVLKESINSGMSRMRNFQRRLIEEGFLLKAFDMGDVFDVDHVSDIEKARKFIDK